MPKLKFATDASQNKFYPISIAAGIVDTERNQRLNVTIASLFTGLGNKANSSDVYTKSQVDTKLDAVDEATSDANGLAMCMALVQLSSVSTMTSITNPEWYYVITDSDDKVLCGVKKDGKAYVYASIEEIMECIIDSYNQV